MKWMTLSLITSAMLGFIQNEDIAVIRGLYNQAAISKTDALQLRRIMMHVDSNSAPVLYCYKGADEMIEAKYALNPFVKWEMFNQGKNHITVAISRDTTDLEMRFLRFSIQYNLPGFLGYREDIERDKRFLLLHTKECKDKELKKMIVNFLTSSGAALQSELKEITN